MSLETIDGFLNEINLDIEKMNSNKDIKKNVAKYNLNIQKIKEYRVLLENTKKTLFESESDIESSEELIEDAQYLKYLDDLDEIKLDISNIKLIDAIEKYKKSLDKINKCKDYLENQKIEITNID
jgi:hypothetical protein